MVWWPVAPVSASIAVFVNTFSESYTARLSLTAYDENGFYVSKLFDMNFGGFWKVQNIL